MRALVTGATGVIGRHLVARLVREGWSVRALARTKRKANRLPKGVQVHLGDLRRPLSLDGIAEGIDVVFHLGAAIDGDWDAHRRATLEGSMELLSRCAASGVSHFVHTSSLAAYETRGLRDGDVLGKEAAIATLESAFGPYAKGKAESERQVTAYADKHGLKTTIVRPGLVYGPERYVFEHLGQKVAGLRVAFGSGKIHLPLVHVDSVVDALIRIVRSPDTGGKAYAIVDSNQVTRSDYLQLLRRITGRRYPAISLPIAPIGFAFEAIGKLRALPGLSALPNTSTAKLRSRALDLRFDCSDLTADTGWQPLEPLGPQLEKSIAEADAQTAEVPTGNKTFRVGVIGAGLISDQHLRALAALPNIDIVGILDPKPGAAKAAAERNGVRAAYEDIDSFFAEAKPDVVHVLTPPFTHRDVVIDSLKRGAHVLCEKPMAMTRADCEAMADAAESAGLRLGVDHNICTDLRFRQAVQMVESGSIGDLLHVDVVMGFNVYRIPHFSAEKDNQVHWAYSLPGGLLEDLAPHPLSAALEFLGTDAEITHVSRKNSGRLSNDLEDELRVCFEGDGISANVALSLSMRPDDFLIILYGTFATIRLDFSNMLLVRNKIGPGPRVVGRGVMVCAGSLSSVGQLMGNIWRMLRKKGSPPADMEQMVRGFYDALESDTPLPISASSALAVVDAIRRIWPAEDAPANGG